MAVERDWNQKRRHHRVTVPIFVAIDGRTYRARDWSLGGFSVEDFAGEVEPGDALEGELTLPYAGFRIAFPVRFEVANTRGSGIGCRFVDLEPEPRKALRALVEAAIEGRIDDVGDVLAAVAQPVPSPEAEKLLGEDTGPGDPVRPKHPLLGRGLAYLAVGLLAALSAGTVTYRNVMFVDIPDGIVVGNLLGVAAPVAGRIEALAVQEGDTVEPGQLLYTLDNFELRGAVARAESRLELARTRVEALEDRLAEEGARLRLFSEVADERVERARAGLRRLDADVERARLEVERRARLHREGIRALATVQSAEKLLEALRAKRDALVSELDISTLSRDATREGRFFGGQEIEGQGADLEEELRVARAAERAAERELEVTLAAEAETRVRAPDHGRVYSVFRHRGELIRPHDRVLTLRSAAQYSVVGRLSPRDALRVYPGMEAQVLLPVLDLRLPARVGAIGHHALGDGSRLSADAETALQEVPVKLVLERVAREIPPGTRVEIRIHTPRGWAPAGSEPPDRTAVARAPTP